MKHSPGPWKFSVEHDHCVITINKDKFAWPACDANDVRLMAAAPEMLNLLQEIVRKGLLAGALSHDVNKAIKKATLDD